MKYELDDFEWNLVREALASHAEKVPVMAHRCRNLERRLYKQAWEQAMLKKLKDEED